LDSGETLHSVAATLYFKSTKEIVKRVGGGAFFRHVIHFCTCPGFPHYNLTTLHNVLENKIN